MTSNRQFSKRERLVHVVLTTACDVVTIAVALFVTYGAYVALIHGQSDWMQWTETHIFLVFMACTGGALSFLTHNVHHREFSTSQFSWSRAVVGVVGLAIVCPPILLMVPMLFTGVTFQDFTLRWIILGIAISPIGFRGLAYQYYESAEADSTVASIE